MSAERTPPDIAVQAALRIARGDYDAWAAAARAAGWCARPVRLTGTLTRADTGTGEVMSFFSTADRPDRVLLKACQSRRATRCPACAAVYQSDARALILAGLVGGKGVTADVAARPVVFVTLTAPGFGAVHARQPDSRPCHPHPDSPTGRAGHDHRCHDRHTDDDPALATPICADCYDWEGTVIWNARAGQLWNRTMIAARRALAARAGITVRAFADRHTIAYVKIVEYQARGVIHLHALARLDPGPDNPAGGTDGLDGADVAAAIHTAAARAAAPNPHQPGRPIRWGPQTHIVVIPAGDRTRLAGYLAKYTTKSVDAGGILDRRLHTGELDNLPVAGHLRRLAQTTWTLADHPRLIDLNLRHWAHTLGYRGHWLTKSRGWSTTLTQLRTDRHNWQLEHHGHQPHDDAETAIGEWAYQGNGHTTPADTWLARHAATNHLHDRRHAWEDQ